MVCSSLGLLLLSEALSLVEGVVIVLSGLMAAAYAASIWNVFHPAWRTPQELSAGP